MQPKLFLAGSITRVESAGYDEINFPGSKFHVVLPLSNLDKGEETMMGAELDYQLG
jgi:hypothetical protein